MIAFGDPVVMSYLQDGMASQEKRKLSVTSFVGMSRQRLFAYGNSRSC
jgi:hypothetical protein